MVFQGQDKWRKHPLLSGNAKRPFPALGSAIIAFSFYYTYDLFKNNEGTGGVKKTFPDVSFTPSEIKHTEMPEASVDK